MSQNKTVQLILQWSDIAPNVSVRLDAESGVNFSIVKDGLSLSGTVLKLDVSQEALCFIPTDSNVQITLWITQADGEPALGTLRSLFLKKGSLTYKIGSGDSITIEDGFNQFDWAWDQV